MNYWLYKGKKINNLSQIEEGIVGFIYQIENLSAKERNKSSSIEEPELYIGRKILHTKRRIKRKTMRTRVETKESDWLLYNGSSKELLGKISQGDKIKKTILMFCTSRSQLNYQEAKMIFCSGCLETSKYYNQWCSARVKKQI